jgi:glycosyltransferase involved in cell wall biosynthesis
MKLGIDARMLVGKWSHRGIGGYIKSILNSFENEKVIAFIPRNQKIEKYNYISRGISIFPIWEQILLPFYLTNKNLTHIIFPSITAPFFSPKKCKKILIVYDLIFMVPFSKLPASRSFYNNFGRLYRKFVFPLIVSKFDYIISISEYSKNELQNKFNIAGEKIHVIPCSITNDWFVNYIIPAKDRKKYFLTVSGDAPSKNLHFLLNTFSRLKDKNELNNFKLIIVGVNSNSFNYFNKLISKLNLSDDVILKKFVTKDELQILYREAWAALTFSLYEGFGVPIVEAMASGTPVVCSDTTSLPEVAGKAAIYLNPRSIDSAVFAINKIINLPSDEREKMSQKGLKISHRYNNNNVSDIVHDFWGNKIF